jgi:PAS domain S-box-containing protein
MLTSFSWISPEGLILVTTDPEIENRKTGPPGLVAKILSGEEYGVGDLHVSPYTGEKMFTIGRGIRDPSGNLLGIISCLCVADKLDPLLAVPRSKGTAISLLDSKGIHVYRYPRMEYSPVGMSRLERQPVIRHALEGNEAAAEVSGPKEERRLAAFVPIPSIGWVAASSRDKHEVIAIATRTLLPHVVLMLLVTLAAFGTAVILSRPISTSIRRLQDHAAVLGQGEAKRVEMVLGPREIKSLSEAFNDMAEKIRSREQALRKSEHKFRVLFENSPDAVFLTSSDGSVAAANPAACKMLGYSEEEICGPGLSGFIDPDEPRLSAVLEERQRTRRVHARELTAIRKSGERFPVEVDWIILPTEPVWSFLIMRDITVRKRVEEALRESEEKFRSIVETTSDRIWETDADGVYTYASRIHDLLGYEPEEVLGREPFEFMPPEESVRMKEKFSGIAKERKAFVGIENVNIRKDGRRVVLETSGVPRLDGRGNFVGYRGIDRDITDRKRAEEALRRSHDQLELRVQERTAELERINQELQNFTFAASHDLQEPLRKIQTFCDLLVTKYFDSVSEQGRDYIRRMQETATRMRDVLQSLMKYSRLTSNAEPFGRVALNEIAREVVSDLELQIRDAGALVEIGDLPEIEADAGQMRQLFQNLLGNGLKFSREGIQPIVRINADCSSQNDICEICFDDNGIGFKEEYLEGIFKPFHRLHGKDKYDGVGMGLSICSKVIEHHRGTITAQSTPGKGSTFIVTLPVKKSK